MKVRGVGFTLAVACLVSGLPGCAGEEDTPDGLEIEVSTAPTPAIVGPIRVVIEVTVPDGPVTDADVRLEARPADTPDRTPVASTAAHAEAGHYVVARLDLAEGGEWLLDIRVDPTEGPEITRQERLRVISEAPSAL